ncbi:MAG: ABC-2 transporter permease [Woeseiaceae bacterium]|nr:ABC-2 transporter permease [Woeseiaceae bacterium]
MTAMTMNAQTSSAAIIRQLVLKDWYFVRYPMAAYLATGIAAAVLMSVPHQMAFMIGSILLLSVVVIVGIHLVFGTVIHERSQQTLPMIMSLPITFRQYSVAKLMSNVGGFAIAWAVLFAVTVAVILTRDNLPDGLVPFAVIALTELFAAFVLTFAVAMISESEAWTIVTMTIFNIGISIFLNLVGSIPAIGSHMGGPSPVWNGTVFLILAILGLIIAAAIFITFAAQARKKNLL